MEPPSKLINKKNLEYWNQMSQSQFSFLVGGTIQTREEEKKYSINNEVIVAIEESQQNLDQKEIRTLLARVEQYGLNNMTDFEQLKRNMTEIFMNFFSLSSSLKDIQASASVFDLKEVINFKRCLEKWAIATDERLFDNILRLFCKFSHKLLPNDGDAEEPQFMTVKVLVHILAALSSRDKSLFPTSLLYHENSEEESHQLYKSLKKISSVVKKYFSIDELLILSLWNKGNSWDLKRLIIQNPVIFELYLQTLMQWIAENVEDNQSLIYKRLGDLFLLISDKTYPENSVIIGESRSLFDLFHCLLQVPDQVDGDELNDFKSRVQIMEEWGSRILSATAMAYRKHCNSSIIQKYLQILPDICDKLINLNCRLEIVKILKHFMKFLQRLFLSEKNIDSLEVIKINTLDSLNTDFHNPGFDLTFSEERIVFRGLFRIDQDSPKIQSLFCLRRGRLSITCIFMEQEVVEEKTHFFCKTDKGRLIIIPCPAESYHEWVNLEVQIKNSDECYLTYLENLNSPAKSTSLKSVVKKNNWDHLSLEDYLHEKEEKLVLFPYFKGQIALVQIYDQVKVTKSKNFMQKMFRKRAASMEVSNSILYERYTALDPQYSDNYQIFLNKNLLENSRRDSDKRLQVYPRNAHRYTKNLPENTVNVAMNPSWNSIMAAEGLEIIWPLTDHLLLFPGERFESLHKDIFLLIKIFNESCTLFPDYKQYHMEKLHTDSKIEAYYRRYLTIEKKSICQPFNSEYSLEYMFLGPFPVPLMLDLSTRFQNTVVDDHKNAPQEGKEFSTKAINNPSFGKFEHFEKNEDEEAKFLYREILKEILGFEPQAKNPSEFSPDLNKSIEYEDYKVDEEDPFESSYEFNDDQKCKLERSITLIGYLFDLYFKKSEYGVCFRYICQALLNPSEDYSQYESKIVASKSNFLCQYILSLIEYYIQEVDYSKYQAESSKFKKMSTQECYIQILEIIDFRKDDYSYNVAMLCDCERNCILTSQQLSYKFDPALKGYQGVLKVYSVIYKIFQSVTTKKRRKKVIKRPTERPNNNKIDNLGASNSFNQKSNNKLKRAEKYRSPKPKTSSLVPTQELIRLDSLRGKSPVKLDSDYYTTLTVNKSVRNNQSKKQPGSEIFWGKIIYYLSVLKHKLATQHGEELNEMYSSPSEPTKDPSITKNINLPTLDENFALFKFLNIRAFLSYISTKVGKSHCIELTVEEFEEIFEYNSYSLLMPESDEDLDFVRNDDKGLKKLLNSIALLKQIFPLLTKWSQLQLIKSDFICYILEAPVRHVRGLLLLFDSGYFSLNYILRKTKQFIEKDESSVDEILQLLYVYEDFLLKHFPKIYSRHEHLCINVHKMRRKHSKSSFNKSINTKKTYKNPSMKESYDSSFYDSQYDISGGCKDCYGRKKYRQIAREILMLLVLYLDKRDLLYHTFPPLTEPTQLNPMCEKNMNLPRNGGIFRIIINSLTLLIESRNLEKDEENSDQTKKNNKSIIGSHIRKNSLQCSNDGSVSSDSNDNEFIIPIHCSKQVDFIAKPAQTSPGKDSLSEEAKQEKLEETQVISIENKALIFHILHYVLWRKESTFSVLLKKIDPESDIYKIFAAYQLSQAYVSKENWNIFDMDLCDSDEEKNLKKQFLCSIPNPSICLLNSSEFVPCYLINFLIYCLIKYNSKQKYYSKENDTKFIRLTTKSFSFVYEIREIIRNYELLSPNQYVSFYECFEEFLCKYSVEIPRGKYFSESLPQETMKQGTYTSDKKNLITSTPLIMKKDLSVIPEEASPNKSGAKKSRQKYLQFAKLFSLCSKMNDKVCRESIKKISNRNIKEDMTDSKYFEEFKNLIGLIDQNRVHKIYTSSCFSKIIEFIKKSLKLEKDFEESELEKFMKTSKISSIDPNTFRYAQDIEELKIFYKQFLHESNDLYYMSEITCNLQDLLKKDVYLYGASPTNIWFNHKIRERIQQEYKNTQHSLNHDCFGVKDKNSVEEDIEILENVNLRHKVISPAKSKKEEIKEEKKEPKIAENQGSQKGILDINLLADLDDDDEELFGSLKSETKIPIHQYSHLQDAGRFKERQFMKISDCYLNGCFDKISEFQDILGRRVMLDIDYSCFDEYLIFPKGTDKLSQKLEALYPYLKQSFMEKLAHLSLSAEGRTQGEQIDISQKAEELIAKEIEKSQILKSILDDQLSDEESYTDQIERWSDDFGLSFDMKNTYEKNLYKESKRIPNPSISRLIEANKIQEVIRDELLDQIFEKANHFECELVEKEGAYWGDIYILKQFGKEDFISQSDQLIESPKEYYLYYKSKNLLLEENRDIDDKRYILRSFEQRKGDIEILISLKNTEIMRKNYLLNPVAVEIYDKDTCRMYFFNFMHYTFDQEKGTTSLRFVDYIESQVPNLKVIHSAKKEFEKMKFREAFKEGKIDKFDYLMLVNKYADRSFNASLSQYPVVPWLNIEDPRDQKFTFTENNYVRKLDKSLCTYTERKRKDALKRYEEGSEDLEYDRYGEAPYHLKLGYSSGLNIIAHLVRVEPYSSLFLSFDNYKMENPDRMVSDIQIEWNKLFTTDQWNMEAIPEMFYMPRIFMNKNLYYFGEKETSESTKTPVCDVKVNIKSNLYFLYCMYLRRALRDDNISSNLNVWIDLIFGKKQQDKKSLNVFYELASSKYYEKARKNLSDEINRENLVTASMFFQLPTQIFTDSHPCGKRLKMRNCVLDPELVIPSPTYLEILKINCEKYTVVVGHKIGEIDEIKIEKRKPTRTHKEIYKLDFNSSFKEEKHIRSISNLIQYLSCGNDKNNQEFLVVAGLYNGAIALIDLSIESKRTYLYPSHMIIIPSIRGETTCTHVVKDSSQILVAYQCDYLRKNSGFNVIASVTLDRKIDKHLHQVVPDFRINGHQSKVICMSASNNIFASLDQTNMLLIHSLYNGQTLNYIKLDSPLDGDLTLHHDTLKIHSIYCNNYYVTVCGTSMHECKISFIQSVGINGDFLGYPIKGKFHIIDVVGDSLKVKNSGKDDKYLNCLDGKAEEWYEEGSHADRESQYDPINRIYFLK
ncbi:unnamed protein product [Moneuplotes crassus]|uniref:BEACH domain-containing protein n=1 Tax=Euplotes crassus TaxID=5936 RepID=A0AAD1Y0X1_EUPCR|nr:unnamed protein product [Moneuplotes crassus]